MSNFLGVEVEGVQGLLSDLKGYEKESERAIDKAVRDTTFAVEADAKKILRNYLISDSFITNKSGKKTKAMRGHGGGGLLGSIYKNAVKSMEGIVGTAKSYAAYIEFGIGELVFTSKQFSAEEKEIAAQFRGTKKVKGFKGVSYLGTAATNQQPKLIERITTNLNAINKA